jgi:hypothetical protein
VFTRALHWSLSRAISIQSTSCHPISLRSILILSTHLLSMVADLIQTANFVKSKYVNKWSPQAVWGWFLAAELQIQSRVTFMLDLWWKGGGRGTGASFTPSFFSFPKLIITPPLFHTHLS